MVCKVCDSQEKKELLWLNCGGFDNSPLYKMLQVVCCKDCGHIYNYLTQNQISGLYKYYTEEYSQCNIDSPNKTGDIPGSSSLDSIKRYENLLSLIKDNVGNDSKILDVGCAVGGFLNFLSKYVKVDNLYGIDPSEKFIDIAKGTILNEKNLYIASAEKLPFLDDEFDILVIDQVVEHLIDPNIFFLEAKRVLKKNGILCVSLPNAMEYKENSFFDFYFYLMREHIHHFDSLHLELIANKHGFSGLDFNITYPNLISNVGTLPNLTMVFRNKGLANHFLNIDIDENRFYQNNVDYIKESHNSLLKRQEYIDSLISKYTDSLINKNINNISIYGMSREFHYLWQNTYLSSLIVKLYDDTATKQKMTVSGLPIESSSYIGKKDKVLITSYAHIDAMKNKLLSMGFEGEFI